MAVVTQTIQDQVTELYLGFFNRAPDAAGFGYWTQKLAAGTSTPQSIANEFSYTPEFVSNYGGLTPQQQVNKIYNNVLNRNADGNGLAYWSAQITAGTPIGTVVWNIVNAAFTQVGTPDGLLVQNKVTVGEYFAVTLASNDGTLAKSAYNLVTSAASSVAAAEASLSGSGGTYILTTGVDLFTGGPNANFIADNTVATTLNASDVLTGVGANNTLKVYSSGAALTFTAANITGIQNMYVNGNGAALDVSAISGLTNLTLNAAAGNQTVTLAGQALMLSNSNLDADTVSVASLTDTTENITLSKVGATETTAPVIDLTGTKVTSATITSSGTLTATQKNTFTLNNTGAKLATLNIAGASAISVTEDATTAAAVKTINASASTGSVTVDTSAAAKAATFAYTGGSGNDTLTLRSGDLAIITNGSQLNAGSGAIDKLVVKETSFTAANIAKLNATVGWDVLGFGGGSWSGSVATLDFNSFNVAAGTTFSLSGLATGSAVSVTGDVSTSLTLAGAVGVHDVAMTLGTATGTGGIDLAGLVVTGLTTISLASLGDDTNANTISGLNNSDSTTITLTGSNDLKIIDGFTNASSVGSVLDASGYTGNLTLGNVSTDGYSSGSAVTLGTSGKGDLIDIGTGAAVLVINAANLSTNANTVNDEITLGSTGVDKIVNITVTGDFIVPVTGTLETINGYGLGLDIIYGAGGATIDQLSIGSDATDIGSGVSINANGLVTAGIGSAAAFLNALAASGTPGAYQSYVYTDGTDTYFAEATTNDANDWAVIKLAGVVATTGITLSGTGAIIS